MANGGVASPTDPVNFLGYSRAELTAAVEEAEIARTYVTGHLYTAESIMRAVECGVSCVEHANLVDRPAAELIAERGAVAVPTLIIFDSLKAEGAELGLPPASVAKIDDVRLAGPDALQTLKNAGVTMGYGTDLLGPPQIPVRRVPAARQGAAEPRGHPLRHARRRRVLRMEGRIGCIAPGAHADMIVVDGDPLKDLTLLTGQGRHMPLIMQGGVFVKNQMNL